MPLKFGEQLDATITINWTTKCPGANPDPQCTLFVSGSNDNTQLISKVH